MSETCKDNRRYNKGVVASSATVLRALTALVIVLVVVLIVQLTVIILHGFSESSVSTHEFPRIIGDTVQTVTSCGYIRGNVVKVNESDVYEFLGVPYAYPPVGELRWKKSRIYNKVDDCSEADAYLATTKRKSCWQFYPNGSYDGSEDCLYLNIWTPKISYTDPLDVVVFSGGETLDGGESEDIQPTSELTASKNVVFVSIGIRRSVLGFLSLNVIGDNSGVSSGNYGLSDILSALQWIKLNIRHFGGNPESVTLLCHQSSSSLMGNYLMYSHPFSNLNLVSKIWLSGGNLFPKPLSLQEVANKHKQFLEYAECDTLECLHRRSPEELLEAVPYQWRKFYFEFPGENENVSQHQWLVFDGEMLVDVPAERQLEFSVSGQIRGSDLIIAAGAPQQNDANVDTLLYFNWNDTEWYKNYLTSKFGSRQATKLYHLYYREESSNWQQFTMILTDFHTICPLLTAYFSKFPYDKALFYVTQHKLLTLHGNVAPTGSDVQAIFGRIPLNTVGDERFVENMQKLFFDFVKSRSRSSKPDTHSAVVQLIDERITQTFGRSNCDFWQWYRSKK